MTQDREDPINDELKQEVEDLEVRNVELEIENDRLRVLAEEGKSSKLGWGAIVGIIVMMIFVMGGGYALGRYVFHMSIVWSIIAAPALFILLILLVVVADWIGLLE